MWQKKDTSQKKIYSEHMKICTVSLVIRKCKLNLSGMPVYKIDNTKYWQRCGAAGTLIHSQWDIKRYAHFENQFGSFTHLSYDPAISVVVYLREMETCS